MEIEAITVPFNGKAIKVIAMNWSDSGDTVIRVFNRETNELAEAKFSADAGIRILHELDISSFWNAANGAELSDSWVFKVCSGGWYDFESSRSDFYMQHNEDKPTEYLITGYQECVSVLSYEAPIVTAVSST